MSIFVSHEGKILITWDFFPDYQEYQIKRQDSLEEGCDGTRSAPFVLYLIPAACNQRGTHLAQKALSESHHSLPQAQENIATNPLLEDFRSGDMTPYTR